MPSIPESLSDDATSAAFQWAAAGVPVAPFDPTKGKGKSCWNLVASRPSQPTERSCRPGATSSASFQPWLRLPASSVPWFWTWTLPPSSRKSGGRTLTTPACPLSPPGRKPVSAVGTTRYGYLTVAPPPQHRP